MIELLALLIPGLSLLTASAAIRARRSLEWRGDLVAHELRFPRDLDAKAVTAFFIALQGIRAPRVWVGFRPRAVALEIHADHSGLHHYLLVPRWIEGIVSSQLRATLPTVAVSTCDAVPKIHVDLAGDFALSVTSRPLRTDAPAGVAAGLLAALQPLQPGESQIIQVILAPAAPVAADGPQPGPRLSGALGNKASTSSSDALRAAREKRSSPLFLATMRIGTAAETGRAAELLHRMTAAYHATNAPGVHLRRRRLPGAWLRRQLLERRLPRVAFPCTLNAAELTGLIGFPIDGPPLPGLSLTASRRLYPDSSIATVGKRLGLSNFPGTNRELCLTSTESLRHLLVLGRTGVGKSTLMASLILSDIERGSGVVVIDPKGDLVTDVLGRIPDDRRDDVVVIDPADTARLVPISVLAATATDPELAVDRLVSIFHNLYREFWGPRTSDVLTNALTALVRDPSATLCDLPMVLSDRTLQQQLCRGLEEPVAAGFWGWFWSLSEAERAQVIGPVMNKFRGILGRGRVRALIGAPGVAFDFERGLAERRIVLVSLARGVLGEEAASLIGTLVLSALWNAVGRRAGLPLTQRPAAFCYIDEAQLLANLPTKLEEALATARGLGLGLCVGHQHLDQLPPGVRTAVLANCATKVIFQVGARDAAVLARELGHAVSADDLTNLGAHEIITQVAVGAGTSAPASAITLPLTAPTGNPETLRCRSLERYGRSRDEIEASIRARFERPRGSGKIGRAS